MQGLTGEPCSFGGDKLAGSVLKQRQKEQKKRRDRPLFGGVGPNKGGKKWFWERGLVKRDGRWES